MIDITADLHLHTTASDGSVTPRGVIARESESGVKLVAITDHDSVSGVDEAVTAGGDCGVKVVPGVEISTVSNCEIHILGYNFDYLNPRFCEELEIIKGYRVRRNEIIGQKLESFGIKPEIDFGGPGVGRMNIARSLVAGGFVADINEAFENYLGVHGKAYTEAKRTTPFGAVTLIKKYGGIAVIAHPKKFLIDKRLEPLIRGLKDYGLDGVEVYYPSHSEADISALLALTARYKLLATGGSDFHGDGGNVFSFRPDIRLLKKLNVYES